ncbi:unnamed protein product, partial [Candidula unifasciata]
VTTQTGISIAQLRSALDICLEQLPPLLDLGDVSQLMEVRCDLSDNPSNNNRRSDEGSLESRKIGCVLFQECLWMNEILCNIRRDIHDLQMNLVGGPGALPQRLFSTACSLQEEQIPVTWVHPNCQPCTHSLLSWLEDLKKRHEQFTTWVQCGLVPKVVEGQLRDFMLTSSLSSVWLGGLVCPQAVLTAIRQEKATLAGVSLCDVNFECVVLKSDTQNELSDSGIHVTDLMLENASWDYETNSLKDSEDAGYTCLRDIYLKPVIKTGSGIFSGDQDTLKPWGLGYAGDSSQMLPGVCDLPVFMNKSRQVQVWSFPVKCPQPEKWILAHAAFILDSDQPYKECKKSKNHQLRQRLHPSVNSNQEEEKAEDEEESREEDDSSEANIDYSEEESSRSSHLSQNIMFPQRSPLPEEFRLHREMPIQSKQNEEEVK